MNDFKFTKGVKIIEGGVEKTYPLYDMNNIRAGLLYTDKLPPEIFTNIEDNRKLVQKRLQVNSEIIDEPIALVGYGPTLKKWWKQLHDYKYIMSMSGSHKFLVERDIIPTYHAEIDFRPRKSVHTNPAHPDIIYLLASIVSPAVTNNMKHCKEVYLWNIKLEGIEYPPDEVVFEAYWDVGTEAILLAKALGFKEQHLFGYDYSYEVDTNLTHAGFHNGVPNQNVFAKVGNKIYLTSDNLCRGCLVFTALMQDNPDLFLKMYSNGLLSAYISNFINQEVSSSVIKEEVVKL